MNLKNLPAMFALLLFSQVRGLTLLREAEKELKLP